MVFRMGIALARRLLDLVPHSSVSADGSRKWKWHEEISAELSFDT